MTYNIAYMMHRGDTNGGFPQHVETIIRAFKDLGHKVDFYYLDYCEGDKADYFAKKVREWEKRTYTKAGQKGKLSKGIGTGEYYDPETGWMCPVTPYKRLEDKIKLKNKLETYDAVFWHTPFWFKQKPVLNDTDWVKLVNLINPVNIMLHHDGNIRSNSAWMYFIGKYFDRMITVHPASYNATSVFETPRTLIFNPQDLSNVQWDKTNYDKIKETGILFSMQNWKGSKHVDDLMRATPYMINGVNVFAAGHGIEARYIYGSEQKMKPKYYTNKKDDPDLLDEYEGMLLRDWAELTENFTKQFWLTEKERDLMLSESAFFIDTAWYTISKKYGSHFSRTLIEAMMAGVVPIARNYGLSDNVFGVGEVFEAKENYIMIPHDATPKEFADIVNKAYRMDREEYDRIVHNNYQLLEYFDMYNVAKQYIDVIEGTPTGWYGDWGVGKPTPEFLKKAESQWFGTGNKRTFNFKR